MVDLSPTHVSVIERGLKAAKLDTFVAIANALEVSADSRPHRALYENDL